MVGAFLAANWRWLAVVVGAFVLLLVGSQLFTACGARRAAKAVHAAHTQHAATVAADAAPARAFDSTFYDLAGQRRESARHLKTSQHYYDSLHRRLPTHLPVFPMLPPRYGPTR